ncbi:MAG: 1-acyl-sn-glycerol-3-phosphate acyltransferase [Clostridiales bacterium]|jgi:predicted nucleic acid-binding Zn ribbon protein|nr:1-acyl-sn-glycerol-3-phosphate acyltransferase [Clostridiales bacterium]
MKKELSEKNKEKKNRANPSVLKRIAFAVGTELVFRGVALIMNSRAYGKRILRDLKEPCLILSTHGSLLDVAYGGCAVIPRYYTGVVAKNLFFIPVLGKILSRFGFISKKQFAVDINCIKSIKQNLENGVSVFMCPEGKNSVDGREIKLAPAIAKLIKWANVPVVFIGIRGSYLTLPRWNMKKPRRGKIRAEVELLFSKDDVTNLSVDGLYQKLLAAFSYNEYEYQEKHGMKFKSRVPAEGIEKLLYKCPRCNAEFKQISQKDKIICTACGNAARLDAYGKITPATDDSVVFPRPDIWADFQIAALKEECKNDGYSLSADVVLSLQDDATQKYSRAARGVLTLTRAGITFAPSEYYTADHGDAEGLFYPLNALPTIPFNDRAINIGCNNKLQSYAFESPIVTTYKWHFAVETLYATYYADKT